MIRFYAPDIESTLALPESDSGHCVRVLRMNNGDTLEITDGKGNLFTCRIESAHQKHTAVSIIKKCSIEASWDSEIVVAVAPTKNMDRMEWMTEKLTEIGVNRIIPLLCCRSERKEIKTQRLEKIAASAMKQSLKVRLPRIDPMTAIGEVIGSFDGYQKFIAYCDRTIPRTMLAKVYSPGNPSVIMIGPEGDFSPEEIRSALDSGWSPVTLGPERLRTETAAIVACDTFHIISQIKY